MKLIMCPKGPSPVALAPFNSFSKKPGTIGEILNLPLQNILKCSKIGIVNLKR